MGDYELLDFGGGGRLERFGPYVLDRPMPVNQVIGLLYRRLIEDVPAQYELDENLVWSITRSLKGVDYLSDYEPLQDPAIIAEMKRQT